MQPLPTIMKKIQAILFILILSMGAMKAQSPNEKALFDLERHIEIGNLSKPISNKLKEYFLNGGELDDADWLYFLQSGFSDIEEGTIAELIEKRNKKISIKSKEIIQVLKEAGFFSKTIPSDRNTYRILKKELVEVSVDIALKDAAKATIKDLEADVFKNNNAYAFFLQELSGISKGNFLPTNILEEWETETGPIRVTFDFQGKEVTFLPEYFDDWLDGKVLGLINTELIQSECGFYTVNSDYITGQDVVILFLNKKEKEVLEKKLNWDLVLFK